MQLLLTRKKMTTMKIVVFFLLFCGAAIAGEVPRGPCTPESEHDFLWGDVGGSDVLLYTGNVQVKPQFMKIQKRQVTLPPANENIETITAIKVVNNLKPARQAGCCSVNNGGVGTNKVVLDFVTQRNYGMSFTYNVYGQKK